jgi:hypothetical protein
VIVTLQGRLERRTDDGEGREEEAEMFGDNEKATRQLRRPFL